MPAKRRRSDNSPGRGLEDARQVMDAAEILRVREIDLFRLAWHRWHGVRGNDRTIERAFVAYMFHRTVPPWVRHYAREVVADAERGRLPRPAHGIVRRRKEPEVAWPGPVYVGLVLAVTILFIAALTATPGAGGDALSVSCDGGPGLRFYAGFAHAFAGTPPPDCF